MTWTRACLCMVQEEKVKKKRTIIQVDVIIPTLPDEKKKIKTRILFFFLCNYRYYLLLEFGCFMILCFQTKCDLTNHTGRVMINFQPEYYVTKKVTAPQKQLFFE